MPFGTANPNCDFVASSCLLASQRQAGSYHAFCVFDKIQGLDAITKTELASVHPISFINAVKRNAILTRSDVLTSGSESDDESTDYNNFGFASQADLLFAFGKALDDVFSEE